MKDPLEPWLISLCKRWKIHPDFQSLGLTSFSARSLEQRHTYEKLKRLQTDMCDIMGFQAFRALFSFERKPHSCPAATLPGVKELEGRNKSKTLCGATLRHPSSAGQEAA